MTAPVSEPSWNCQEMLDGVLATLRIAVRVATSPEVRRALVYRPEARKVLLAFVESANSTASLGVRLLVAAGEEDSGEHLTRSVSRVTLSRRR